MIQVSEMDLFSLHLVQKKYKSTEIVSLNSFHPDHVEGIYLDFFSLAHKKDFVDTEICWLNIDSGIIKIDVRAFLWKRHLFYLQIFILKQLSRKNKIMDRSDVSSPSMLQLQPHTASGEKQMLTVECYSIDVCRKVHSKLRKSWEREEKNDPSHHSPLCFSAMFCSY